MTTPHSPTPQSLRQRWDERYHSGVTPWDTQITPPEVVAFWQSGRLPRRGLVLDIGCGPGTNVAYLARLGLRAVGVDIAMAALQTAHTRIAAQEGEWRNRTHFALADVTQLPFTRSGAVYILDIGCFHGVPPEGRNAYVQGIIDNLAPGGYYHLFAFDRRDNGEGAPPERSMEETEVADRFAPHLSVEEIIQGNPDRHPCRWYLLRKQAT